ncbi:hypothetical protein CYY_000045 [Polysphondylium violaceum]|uniref:SIR2-like domain-containing protein n=1 Tax=Polysphondylium violaceum TaxID=133409 RepID=A0A8J4VBY5_9MYCE|nr:hypothetical protein CYY_000045 [Polysphondylium violaceum]
MENNKNILNKDNADDLSAKGERVAPIPTIPIGNDHSTTNNSNSNTVTTTTTISSTTVNTLDISKEFDKITIKDESVNTTYGPTTTTTTTTTTTAAAPNKRSISTASENISYYSQNNNDNNNDNNNNNNNNNNNIIKHHHQQEEYESDKEESDQEYDDEQDDSLLSEISSVTSAPENNNSGRLDEDDNEDEGNSNNNNNSSRPIKIGASNGKLKLSVSANSMPTAPAKKRIKYFPLTQHLGKLDQIKKVQEIENDPNELTRKEIKSMFEEDKSVLLPTSPEKRTVEEINSSGDDVFSTDFKPLFSSLIDDTTTNGNLSSIPPIIPNPFSFTATTTTNTKEIITTTITTPTPATTTSTSPSTTITPTPTATIGDKKEEDKEKTDVDKEKEDKDKEKTDADKDKEKESVKVSEQTTSKAEEGKESVLASFFNNNTVSTEKDKQEKPTAEEIDNELKTVSIDIGKLVNSTTIPTPSTTSAPIVSPDVVNIKETSQSIKQEKTKIYTNRPKKVDVKNEYFKYIEESINEEVNFQPSTLPKESDDDGHLFLLYGDLTKLVCDVKMVPCSHHSIFRVALSSWLKYDWAQFPIDIRKKFNNTTIDFKANQRRVCKLESWPIEYPNISQPWFCNVVPFSYLAGPSWYIKGAKEFLDSVGKDLLLKKPPIKNGRSKYLVSLPILGTGGGGGSGMAGEILTLLIHELFVATRVWKYDIVLVTNEISMYTAARNKRMELMESDRTFSHLYRTLLGQELMNKAHVLSKMMDQGKLAIFIGAGASRSAGLPTWAGLLQMLGDKLGMTEEEIRSMEQLHYLDRATVLESRWKKALAKYSPPEQKVQDREEIKEIFEIHKTIYNEINVPMQTEIANLMKVSHSGLPHFLLASTPVQEIITTNYDECFEIASKSIGQSICVLPYQSLNSHDKRWILKLHGCVSNPQDIVITREDYIRYGDKKEALSGILQASLITKHLLFVGFSLVDDNFYNVMSAVKKVTTSKNRKKKFGTALFLQKNDLMNELWGQELDILCFESTVQKDQKDQKPSTVNNATSQQHKPLPNDIANCARRQEIFLEYLSNICISNTSHLMEKRFDCLLKDGEKIFRDRILEFVENLPQEAKDTSVYLKFQKFLSSIGFDKNNVRLRKSCIIVNHEKD